MPIGNGLADTVARLQPHLLIFHSFVRLHRIDENASGEVAPLLAYLRELQRRYGVAVLVVHHARKSSGDARAGQALHGSSEFHAWGDSYFAHHTYPIRSWRGNWRVVRTGLARADLRIGQHSVKACPDSVEW
jgi:hypothetical protein